MGRMLALVCVLLSCVLVALPADASVKVFGSNRLKTTLEASATRRVDVVWIVNSHGLQGGHGYEQGFIDAMVAEGYTMYASGWMSAMAGDGATGYGSGEGWQGASSAQISTAVLSTPKIAMVAQNGGNWTALIPAALLKHCNQFGVANTRTGTVGYSPIWPLYWHASTLNCQQGPQVYGTTPLGDPTSQYRFHVTVGQYGTGGGSTTIRVRRADSPFTTVVDQAVNFATGTQGDVSNVAINVAADAGRSGYAGLGCIFGVPNITGPAMIYGSRIERPDRTTGFSVHMSYSAGGRSARDMYNWATTIPDETWDFLFDRWTELQGGAKADRVLAMMVSEAHNQQSETLVHASAPNQGDADAPENYAFYMAGVVGIARQQWLAWGGSADKIVFGVHANHPRNDGGEAELITYRNALMGVLGSGPDISYIAQERIRPLATMVSAGDFSGDSLHLTGAAHPATTNGYYRVMSAMVGDILNQTTGTPQTAERSYGTPGPVKFYRYIPNGTGAWDSNHAAWDDASIVPIIAPVFDEDDDMAERLSKTIEASVACDAAGRSVGITFRNLLRSQYSPYGPMGRGLDGGLFDPHEPVPAEASFYCNNGISNAITMTEPFFWLVRSEFAINGFRDPSIVLEENEDHYGYAPGNGTFTQAKLVGRDDPGTPESIYPPSLTDSRASDDNYPVFFDVNTGGPNTIAALDARRDGDGVTYDDEAIEYGESNEPFRNWFARLGVYQWIMQEAMYSQVRGCFPEAMLISYNAVRAPASGQTFLQMSNPEFLLSDADYFPLDAHGPAFYGFDRQVHEDAGVVGVSSLATVTDSQHWRDFVERNRRAAYAGNPLLPCVPFLLNAGTTTPGATYEPTAEDNLWYLRRMRTFFGDDAAIIFQSDDTEALDDSILSLARSFAQNEEQRVAVPRIKNRRRLAERERLN